jgi:ferritin-like metal-binding protein YciE
MRKGKKTLQDLLLIKIEALFDAEDCLKKTWRFVAKGVSHTDLKKIVQASSRQNRSNQKSLGSIFRSFGIKPVKLQGEAVRGLSKDANWVIKNIKGKDARDANLIAAMQYIVHYQIAGYGSARAWAEALGNAKAEQLLRECLEHANTLDQKLSTLATSKINKAVANAPTI